MEETKKLRPTVTIAVPGSDGGKGGSGGAPGGTGMPSGTQSATSVLPGRTSTQALSKGPKSTTGKDASSAQPPKLPICPEGQIMTANQTPCERPPKGRNQPRRKPGFRVPLKKEDGNMEAQIIEYNCEFPNRVVVRLEYLMQTTKVRLNDRNYMDDFYEKLLEEERLALQKATRLRERAEQNRMKKLIIDGVDKDIPPELSYLHKHPVFRVNQMLGRLSEYDTHLALQPVPDDDEITPVEPYEYNGNKFFKHLHDTGDLWVPSVQRLYDEDKLEGKIYRAKLRLLQKRKEAAAEEKVLRILNNIQQQQLLEEEDDMVGGEEGDMPPPIDKTRPSWLVDFEKQKHEDDTENAKLNKALKMNTTSQPFSAADMAVEKIKANAHKEIVQLSHKIQRSKEKEKEQEALLELKRQEQEIHYVDTFNYDKARIISNFDKHQRHGQVDDLFNRQDQKARKSAVESGGKPKPYERIFELPPEAENDDKLHSTKFEHEPLFNKLKKVYGVKSTFPFHHYDHFDNELILEYLDNNVEDGNDLLTAGEYITNLYERELMVADDHVNSQLQKAKQAKAAKGL